jgi:hypothetical protein
MLIHAKEYDIPIPFITTSKTQEINRMARQEKRKAYGKLDEAIRRLFVMLDSNLHRIEGISSSDSRALKSRGLSYSEIGYILKIQTGQRLKTTIDIGGRRKKKLDLDQLRKGLHALERDLRNRITDYEKLDDYYSRKSNTASVLSRECRKLADIGTLRRTRLTKRPCRYWLHPEAFDPDDARIVRDVIANTGASRRWSNGIVSLFRTDLLKRSGFSDGMIDTIAKDVEDAFSSLGQSWIKQWEKSTGRSLDRIERNHLKRSEELGQLRDRNRILWEVYQAKETKLDEEYHHKIPRFPLIVVDVDFDQWLL